MITLSVTEFARNFKKIMDLVEFRGEEVTLVRNRHKVARLSPGHSEMTAIEAMSDLYRTIPDTAGADWAGDGRTAGTLGALKNPWE